LGYKNGRIGILLLLLLRYRFFSDFLCGKLRLALLILFSNLNNDRLIALPFAQL
jgi:hypothetical protein